MTWKTVSPACANPDLCVRRVGRTCSTLSVWVHLTQSPKGLNVSVEGRRGPSCPSPALFVGVTLDSGLCICQLGQSADRLWVTGSETRSHLSSLRYLISPLPLPSVCLCSYGHVRERLLCTCARVCTYVYACVHVCLVHVGKKTCVCKTWLSRKMKIETFLDRDIQSLYTPFQHHRT